MQYKFLKAPRNTMTAEMITVAKKANVPAPNAYPASPLLGNIKHYDKKDDRQDKFCGFIDEAKYFGG